MVTLQFKLALDENRLMSNDCNDNEMLSEVSVTHIF